MAVSLITKDFGILSKPIVRIAAIVCLGFSVFFFIYQGHDSVLMRCLSQLIWLLYFLIVAYFLVPRAPVVTSLLLLGSVSNFTILAANTFQMPVIEPVPGILFDNFHVLCSPDTRLMILGDWIPIGGGFASIGDFLLLVATYSIGFELQRRRS